MSLGNGRTYLAIPGPSVMPERVLRAMHRAAPNIYAGELPGMMPKMVRDLKAVARTSHHAAIYIANGHGTWEAANANVFSRGDTALVAATGRFGHGWAAQAAAMGIRPEILDFGRRDAIDTARVAERLAADREHSIRAVLACQVDTASGVRSDIAALRAAIDETGHPALLMIDCIASLGCDRFEMDAWGADVTITASQKGLMTPPGLGFVFFNDRADAARGRADCVTHYWDWRPRSQPEIFSNYFDGTAPTHHLYGLREALDMIAEEGLENVWRRHAVLARAVWEAIGHWGEDGPLELNVREPENRSHAVTAIRAGTDKAAALRAWCEERAGLTLGIGLGWEESEKFFRIGHMGHVNAQMILGALATIEAGLKAVGLPHRPGGVVKAAEVIASEA